MIEEMDDAAVNSLKFFHVFLQREILQHHRHHLAPRGEGTKEERKRQVVKQDNNKMGKEEGRKGRGRRGRMQGAEVYRSRLKGDNTCRLAAQGKPDTIG